MNVKNKGVLCLAPLLIIACSNSENTRYKDLSHLEAPPVITIAETAKKPVVKDEEAEAKTGLGQVVSLAGPVDLPILNIKKNFDRSWEIVEQALNFKKIEITDKNRDRGIFYLKFDPDEYASKGSSLMDKVNFFFEDGYAEAHYKLTLKWRDSYTEAKIELTKENNESSDDEDDFEDTLDPGGKLIKLLYKTIRDDLPLN